MMLCANLTFGQYKHIDKVMDEMPNEFDHSVEQVAKYIAQNFTLEDDKIRAVYYWITSTFSYDVDFDLSQGTLIKENTAYILKNKIGVCRHYAQLFNDIANTLGVKTYTVPGYTKDRDGKISKVGHLWNVSRINNKWFMFDSTWGAGYVQEGTFHENINNGYYKLETNKILKDHLPFDYMWQLSPKPLTFGDFEKSVLESNAISENYDYETEINVLEKISEAQKVKNELTRMKALGVENKLQSKQFEYLNDYLNYLKFEPIQAEFKSVVDEYNKDANTYKDKKITLVILTGEIKLALQKRYNGLLVCESNFNNWYAEVKPEERDKYKSFRDNILGLKHQMENQLKEIQIKEKLIKKHPQIFGDNSVIKKTKSS